MPDQNDQPTGPTPGRVVTGMAKWEIHFTDGNTCTMLSDQCRNTQEAMQAAIERFGHRVKDVL